MTRTEPQSEDFRRRPPEPLRPRALNLPLPEETTLSNGLRVVVIEQRRLPLVSFRLAFRSGDSSDPSELPGLTDVMSDMLVEGTESRTSRQIAEEIERLGANVFASSGFGSSAANVGASGLSDNFDQWFALFADVLLNPTFPADELAKLRTRQKTSLRLQRTQPGFLAQERFRRAVYGSHPAAVFSATPESLDALTPEQLARWHSERYAPQNAILGIAGDVNARDVIAKLKQAFAGWKKTDAKEVLPPHPTPAANKKIFLIDRPDSVQSTITMGNIAIDRRSPDYVPVVVMDSVVGGGASARLFLNLREDKGYTYGVYSGFTAVKYPGPWSAGGDVRTEVTEGALNELVYELKRIRDEAVPAAELEEKKRAIVAAFALSLESPASLLNYEVTRKIYGLPADYWDTYPSRIMAVTAADVQRVAERYIQPDKFAVVVVGDRKTIEPGIRALNLGPVRVVSVDEALGK